MQPVVAIVSPGNMGAAVGARLVEHGVKVLTTLDGRSAASDSRAAQAGMTVVPLAAVLEADVLLSILPPAVAEPFALQMAPLLRQAQRRPVFVDCNAVSPATVQRIGAEVTSTGTPFIDAGIIGQPPEAGRDGPRFFACGEHVARFQALAAYGLDVRVLEGPIGAASALKLSFAGINKGITAIVSVMVLAASRAGAAAGLHRELAEQLPHLLKALSRQVPGMIPKAYRWAFEMQQIAEFVGEDSAGEQMFMAASTLYERVARDARGSGPESRELAEFFAPQLARP
jgi:3-hydroxyisobutyrate dehydrogenase-like beta-hydroxyacid dehydrogenase